MTSKQQELVGIQLGQAMAAIICDAARGKDINNVDIKEYFPEQQHISEFADYEEVQEAFNLFTQEPDWDLGMEALTNYQRSIIIEHKLKKWEGNKDKVCIYLVEAKKWIIRKKAPYAFVKYIADLIKKYNLN